MKRKINPVGLLSLVSLISLLGIITKNQGWFGFLGFLYYLRYFWVVPDEGFWMNIEKSATLAFFTQLFLLFPLLFFTGVLMKYENYIPLSFGICFSVGVLVFSVYIAIIEWRKAKGIIND